MRNKLYWKYYVTENGEDPKLGERQAVLWNTAVFGIDLREAMFYGDLDKTRIEILKNTTKNRKNRLDIILYNERGDPIYLIHDGNIYNIGDHIDYP